ncbi:MAG TPA: 3'-5' exonuclease [Fimbriiglobus sp.]|nr:3'-5' exonuclease [Fimbriiglobus sp.]
MAVLRLVPGAQPSWFYTLIDPGVPIPAEASAVHRISDWDVRGKPWFGAVAQELYRFLSGADLLAYNAPFDLAMLAGEFARAGLRFKVRGRSVVDPLVVFRRQEPRTLGHAVLFYLGRASVGAHSVVADVINTLEVLDVQVGRYGLPASPAELHRLLVPVDVAGKFARGASGELQLAFGKHWGRPLALVAREDPDYMHWIMNNVPLLDDARELIHRALAGQLL